MSNLSTFLNLPISRIISYLQGRFLTFEDLKNPAIQKLFYTLYADAYKIQRFLKATGKKSVILVCETGISILPLQ